MHAPLGPRNLTDDERWTEVRRQDLAVIYKHSTRCWSSSMALRQVEEFVGRHPDVPVYLVDVLFDRDLSRRIARDTAVRHESPQVIVLRAGQAMWHASHGDVSVAALEAHAVLAVDT